MELLSNFLRVKIIPVLAFFILFSLNSIVLGQTQDLPQINARFSNPQFHSGKRMFFLDVELKGTQTTEYLFGMNVRFFYDASKLEFRYFDQFSDGYGPLGDPAVIMGNGQSGLQLFDMKGATAFVNGAMQQQSEQSLLAIDPNKWVKAFRVCFKLPSLFPNEKTFCPSVFWDLKPVIGSGGFLVGDDGLTITILDKDPSTPDQSAPVHVTATSFNWEANSTEIAPYGKTVPQNCVSLQKLSSRDDEGSVEGEYELFQNEPNPFNQGTTIEFVLPSPQKVTLKFYDVSGKAIDEIKGEYKSGRNIVNLTDEPWLEGAKVIFYCMETEDFKSKMLKMTLID